MRIALVAGEASGDALVELKARATSQPELRIFVDFISESTRSLVR